MIDKKEKIYISGHKGLLGSAMKEHLLNEGFTNILTATRNELDLTRQKEVEEFFNINKPSYVIHCAAKAGGIMSNIESPYDYINENLQIQNNSINSSFNNNVKKFIFASSTCIYPKKVKQPMKELDLLTGKFTPEFQPYSLAKLAGMEMLSSLRKQKGFDSISVLLPNLYGPGDHYGDDSNHVIPALIEKFVLATLEGSPQVEVWGSGKAVREFLNVRDASKGILFLLASHKKIEGPINLSSEKGIKIKDLAKIISKATGYKGKIVYDSTKPEGSLIKISDSNKIKALGWNPTISLEEGIEESIVDYKSRFLN